MTTIPFLPSASGAPPFQATVTLDGNSYSMTTTWNLYRTPETLDAPVGDWYVQLYDQSGNIVINQPLVGSPPDSDIELFPGLFTASTVVYRVSTGMFEISP